MKEPFLLLLSPFWFFQEGSKRGLAMEKPEFLQADSRKGEQAVRGGFLELHRKIKARGAPQLIMVLMARPGGYERSMLKRIGDCELEVSGRGFCVKCQTSA